MASRRCSGSLDDTSSRNRSPCAGSPMRLSDASTRFPSSRRRFCSNSSRSAGPASRTRSTPTACIARRRTPVDSSASSGISALPSSAVPILPSSGRRRLAHLGLGILQRRDDVARRPRGRPGCRARRPTRRGCPSARRAASPASPRNTDGVDDGVRRDRRAVVLVGEGLQEAVDRAGALALRVDLDDRGDGLLADLRVAVLQRGDERRDRRDVAQLAQRADHLEAHARLGVAHQGRQRGHRLAPAALAERRRRGLPRPRGRALQVGHQVLERVLGRGGSGREQARRQRQDEAGSGVRDARWIDLPCRSGS